MIDYEINGNIINLNDLNLNDIDKTVYNQVERDKLKYKITRLKESERHIANKKTPSSGKNVLDIYGLQHTLKDVPKLTKEAILRHDTSKDSYNKTAIKIDSNFVNTFYDNDYRNLCHKHNSRYDFERLKKSNNDFDFQFDYRDISRLDPIVNKYINITVDDKHRHRNNFLNIASRLLIENVAFDRYKLMSYYNEWLHTTDWINMKNNILTDTFIKCYKDFINKYNVMVVNKHYSQSYPKRNKNDYINSSTSIFYDGGINESSSLYSNVNTYNHHNSDYYNDRPSVKYKQSYATQSSKS